MFSSKVVGIGIGSLAVVLHIVHYLMWNDPTRTSRTRIGFVFIGIY